jgi:hypothetical protein
VEVRGFLGRTGRRVGGDLGEAFNERPVEQQLAVVGTGVVALIGALIAARLGFAIWLRLLHRALRTARFWFLVATLSLYRPCPDCHKYIHADARVCHRCGYRRVG